MSEYQYYEFQKVDGRLSEIDQDELRKHSTRAQITASSFANVYDWGDFKGDTGLWMERYFDGHLYLANWGTHELQLAIPAGLLPLENAKRYSSKRAFVCRQKAGRLFLTFCSEDDSDEDWQEGKGLLSSMLPIRDELARGDLRSLYLGWLLVVETGELKDSEKEPPVPPNLGKLTGPQQRLADFLRVDSDLLAVAAQNSACDQVDQGGSRELSDWVITLPPPEKDEILRRLVTGGGEKLRLELQARFHRQRNPDQSAAPPKPRTVAELVAAADAWQNDREQKEAQRTAFKRAREAEAAARERAQFLDSLRGRCDSLWAEAESFTAARLPRHYDQVVLHLGDLRDLAELEGKQAGFTQRLALFQSRHASRKALLSRIDRRLASPGTA